MSGSSLAPLRNRRSVALSSIPELPLAAFRETVFDAVREGWRIVALFGAAEGADRVRVIGVLAHDESGDLGAVTAIVGER